MRIIIHQASQSRPRMGYLPADKGLLAHFASMIRIAIASTHTVLARYLIGQALLESSIPLFLPHTMTY
jgi:hypothetical protein